MFSIQKYISILFFSEGNVEACIPWSANTTQQIDLVFNIFFMVYFFIRVSDSWSYFLKSIHF